MKLLLDMNIPIRFSHLLAAKGIEAVRWSDVGLPNAADVEIMEYARGAILSIDLKNARLRILPI
ncbi:MAG: DUF5615 family PIN-like protein [Defluviitaleaceae bacterium]|nr:DUF5615 family PIN-like protein [Defluviitaleaceae bacterium]